MGFHFRQNIVIRRTGFGNSCLVELGTPTPIADELLYGSELVDFDTHPYLATSGWGNLDPSEYPEQAVGRCTMAMVTHRGGLTRTQLSVDFTDLPSFWGIEGLNRHKSIYVEENVKPNPNLTQVELEVDYDSTVYVAFDISRVSFQYVRVRKDDEITTFRNVACLPYSSWRNAFATFRMWGKTESWGSEDEKFLTIPSTTVRKV